VVEYILYLTFFMGLWILYAQSLRVTSGYYRVEPLWKYTVLLRHYS